MRNKRNGQAMDKVYFYTTKNLANVVFTRFQMVRQTGLEPVRQGHTPLKRACLPVPALPHLCYLWGTEPNIQLNYYIITGRRCQVFLKKSWNMQWFIYGILNLIYLTCLLSLTAKTGSVVWAGSLFAEPYFGYSCFYRFEVLANRSTSCRRFAGGRAAMYSRRKKEREQMFCSRSYVCYCRAY